MDEDGRKAKRNPHIDILKLTGSADGQQVFLQLALAGGLPEKISSVRQQLNYLFVVAADSLGEGGYWILVSNLEAGNWTTDLTDFSTGQGLSGESFPGTGSVDGNLITISIELAALGSPSQLRISAITQRAEHDTGYVVAEDQVPAGEQYVPAAGWLKLGA